MRSLWPVLILLFPAISQEQSGLPSITINYTVFGETSLSGRVHNIQPNAARVLVVNFVADLGWYTKPNCAFTVLPVQADGNWFVNTIDANATRVAAYLVPPGFVPACVLGPAQVPQEIEGAALARALVTRPHPDPPSIRFSGLDWVLKSAQGPVWPGPNLFSPSTESVWVDAQGRLHLKIRRCGNGWCSAEIFSRDFLGYGTWRWVIDSDLSTLDANAVLGLFSWSEDGASNNREIDIEVSRWGNPNDNRNAQFVVQPYTEPNHLFRFTLPSAPGSTHEFQWRPNGVNFVSAYGSTGVNFSYPGPAGVPPTDGVQAHINLYLANGAAPRNGQEQEVIIRSFEFIPAGQPTVGIEPATIAVPFSGGSGTIPVSASSPGCLWSVSTLGYAVPLSPASGVGSGVVRYTLPYSSFGAVQSTVSISSTNCDLTAGQQRAVIRQGSPAPCEPLLSTQTVRVEAGGGYRTVGVTLPNVTCSWAASPASGANWVEVQAVPAAGVVTLNIGPNMGTAERRGQVTIAGLPVAVIQAGTVALSGLRFVPVTPCRVADTRVQGPVLTPGAPRSFGVRQSPCGVPATARAYSLNVTAVPRGPLGFLTLWPTGEPQPVVSTLNSFDGSIVANAAIVPAGSDGAVSVFASNSADVILDINGYFAPTDGLAFFPITPCRIADTRDGGYGALFGPPALSAAAPQREFPLRAGRCGLPGTAQAYSLNVTVVPRGPLPFLTVWPSGVARPVASTLNTFEGRVISNAAILPAGVGGAVQAFGFLGGSDAADVILDVNGYFAPPGPGGLLFYPVTPCRVADTRLANGRFGVPNLGASVVREFPVPLSVCGIPAGARAYSLNLTAVPDSYLGYLTAWPTGEARPFVSTLNSWEGLVRANAAILPAGAEGAVSVFTAMNPGGATDLILDINGYFAP